MANQLGKVPALDGLRTIAIAGVFGLHVARPQFSGGFLGVDVFFTLSAFLITSLVMDETAQRGGDYSFRGFYKRRAARLGPALLLWFFLLATPLAFWSGDARKVPQSLAIVLTYTNDFLFGHLAGAYGHSWSLAVEEQFYLVWPLLLVLVLRRGGARLLRRILLVAVPAALVIMIIGRAAHGDADYFWPSGHLVPLTLGCLAADLRKHGMPEGLRALVKRPGPPLILGLALAFLMLGFRFIGGNSVIVPATTAAALATAWLILHSCEGVDSTSARLLASAPARWMGQRSYGMYLYSLTVLGLVPYCLPGQQARVVGAITLLVSLPLVDLSYRYIERPITRRAHAGRPAPQAAAQAAG